MLSAGYAEISADLDSFLEENLRKELLRFTTAGSVDDGKSTLIGRLLHDSKGVYEDQLASIRKSRINRSGGPIDFSLLTDGLRAEREQGITIDVAYRYFSTPERKFIIADTPGHEQYTRNMATGASTADLAVILIDATKGLLAQTRRHAYIAALLGIPKVVGAVNKMDLLNYDQSVFLKLQADFEALAAHLGIPFVQCIPISALEGDNIVTRSSKTGWYSGPTLLRHLETVPIHANVESSALRFPVQSVIRPDRTFRGISGRVLSGRIRPGDSVLALPSGQQTTVQAIVSYDGELAEAIPAQSVVLTLEKEIDLSRGDMIVSARKPPRVSNRFAAMLVWLHERPLRLNQSYLLKHAGRQVKAKATAMRFRIDVAALSEHPANELEMNGIAFVEFQSSSPLYFDPYRRNRTTGSFILIDPLSNATVGAAMIREDLSGQKLTGTLKAAAIHKRRTGPVTQEDRQERYGHRAAIFSVQGDSKFAELLELALFETGFATVLLKAEQIPSPALSIVLRSLLDTGHVIIRSSGSLTLEEKSTLQSIAGESLFEITVPTSPDGTEEALTQALEKAQTLRVIKNVADQRKAD
jgi:bifunctional enzyme CysN/CysC/sulfate adenylyltransferase subunit 1